MGNRVGLKSDEFFDKGIHLVTGTDFNGKEISWDQCYRISEERYAEDPYIHLRENDLLVTKDGSIGKLARVTNLPNRASLNSGIFLVRPINNVYSTDFLYWVLSSSSFYYFVDLSSNGTTINHLYQNVFENFEFPLPKSSEQQTIAAFLDRETAKIDTLITEQERLIELLKEKRSALISHAVTKGLNPNVPMKDSGVEWLGKIPGHWEAKRLKYNLSLLTEKTDRRENPVALENIESWTGRFIQTETLFEGEGVAFLPGDILFGKLRPYLAKALLAKFSGEAVGDFFVMRPSQDVNSSFILYQILNKDFISIIDGSTFGAKMPRVSWEFMSGVILAIPPNDEQKAIVTFLDRETAKIDALITKSHQAIDFLKERRTALISAAVTGKIDVRDTIN